MDATSEPLPQAITFDGASYAKTTLHKIKTTQNGLLTEILFEWLWLATQMDYKIVISLLEMKLYWHFIVSSDIDVEIFFFL